jgi:hypothetical protein
VAEASGAAGSAASPHAARRAAALSGLFNTATRAGGVTGIAAFGTVYLALVHHAGQAVHGFAVLNFALAATALAATALAATALAATAMATVSVRRR